jgi:hypothetical protein
MLLAVVDDPGLVAGVVEAPRVRWPIAEGFGVSPLLGEWSDI